MSKYCNNSTGEGLILCVIIDDVDQYNGHCLFPLDPWDNKMDNNKHQNNKVPKMGTIE